MSEKHERIYTRFEEGTSVFSRAVSNLMIVAKTQKRTADADWVRTELAESGNEEFLSLSKDCDAIARISAQVNDATVKE